MEIDFIERQMQRSDLTTEEAVAIGQSGDYKKMEMAKFAFLQLQQELLCGNFSYFHEALEVLLGRPVFTHELINRDGLIQEALGRKDLPTFEEIIGLIPNGKAIIVKVGDED